jgi:hypothetical protein
MELDEVDAAFARFDFRDPAMGHVQPTCKFPLRKAGYFASPSKFGP